MKIGVNCTNLVERIGGLRVYFGGLFDFLQQHDRGNEYVFFYMRENRRFLDGLRNKAWRERGIPLTHPSGIAGHRPRSSDA